MRTYAPPALRFKNESWTINSRLRIRACRPLHAMLRLGLTKVALLVSKSECRVKELERELAARKAKK